MNIAIWIIAVCEVIRMAQNMIQIMMVKHDSKGRDNAYAEFVKSLKRDDAAFVHELLKEFESKSDDGGEMG